MLRMASAMGGPSPFGGNSGFGSPFGTQQPAFPAPGTPNTNPTSPTTTSPTSTTTPPAASPPLNPFALFGAAPGTPGGFNPALMQQMLAGNNTMGPGVGAAGGWGGFGDLGFGMANPPVPSDTRPPEERFQVQLQASLLSFIIIIIIIYRTYFPSIDYSNYKRWDLSTPPRMFVRFWRQEGMFRVRLSIYSVEGVFDEYPVEGKRVLSFLSFVIVPDELMNEIF